jgi:hypothetical protein
MHFPKRIKAGLGQMAAAKALPMKVERPDKYLESERRWFVNLVARLLLCALLMLLNGAWAAEEKHPASITGRWAMDAAPSQILVFEASGTLKRLKADRPLADLGYWEQTGDSQISVKVMREEPHLLRFAIDGNVLRLTNDSGDTIVYQRQAAIRPADILGAWQKVESDPTLKRQLMFFEDGTFEASGNHFVTPKNLWPSSSGVWRWLENDWIEFRAPGTEPSLWQVKIKDDLLKFVSHAGEIVKFERERSESPAPTVNAEVRKPAPNSDEKIAELEAMRRVRATILEEEVMEQIKQSGEIEKTDPNRAIAMLRVNRTLVSESDDLAEKTRSRLLDQLDQRIRGAIVRARER